MPKPSTGTPTAKKARTNRANQKRHLQGDGRPFGIAPMQPSAVVKAAELMAAIEAAQLDLTDDEKLTLAGKVRPIFSRYLGEQMTADRKASNDRSRELLEMIDGAAQRLADHLRGLDNKHLVAIDKHRALLAGDEQVRHFDLLHLGPALNTLGRAAFEVARNHKALPQGRQRNVRLDDALSGLLANLNGKLPVHAVDAGSSVEQRKQVRGAGGTLLKALFRTFDPDVTEAMIYQSVKRAQKKAGQHRTPS